MSGSSSNETCVMEPVTGPAAGETAGYEVSPQQRQAWLLQRAAGTLHYRATVELDGPLDPQRLRRAAQQLAAEHEILRTTFRRVPGRGVPVQVIHDDLPPEWREENLEGLDPEASARRHRGLLEQPPAFDLERGPLFRLSLVRLNATRHLLTLCL